jgi:hypothetical protein
LHLAFDKLFDVDGTIDAMSCKAAYCWSPLVLAYLFFFGRFLFDRRCHGVEGERTLKDFKILKVCVFSIDVELHSGHRDIEVNTVENLAESRTMFNAVSKV